MYKYKHNVLYYTVKQVFLTKHLNTLDVSIFQNKCLCLNTYVKNVFYDTRLLLAFRFKHILECIPC